MWLVRVLSAVWLALALPFIQGCAPAGGNVETPQEYALSEQSTNAGTQASSNPAAQVDEVKPIYVPGMSDAELSRDVTDWLHRHRLPLVATQVHTSPDGQRQVILYGFVATSYGKQDAETKARELLENGNLALSNRIAIRPELAAQGSGPAPATFAPSSAQMPLPDDPASTELAGAQTYQQQQPQSAQRSWTADLLPILMLAAMIGLTFVGGGGAAYPGIFPGYP